MELTNRVSEKEILSNLINLRQLVIEVTDLCNLKCSYCAYGELYQTSIRETGHLTFERIKPLLDYLLVLWQEREKDKVTDIGFYGGEPLLNMNLIRHIISYLDAENNNKSYTYSMTTNGLLLDRYMDYLVEKDFDLLISLDGDEDCQCYRKSHKGTNSFMPIMNNVMLLREKYPIYFDKKVNFHSILHNKSSVRKVLYFFLNQFNKIPSIAEISPIGIREEKRDVFESMYQSINDSIIKDPDPDDICKKLGDEHPSKILIYQFLKAYSGNIYDSYNALLAGNTNNRTPTGTCHPFQMKLFVSVRGEIMQCEQISREWIYGFVSNNGLFLNLAEIARKYNSLLDNVCARCQKCSIAASCPVCLFNTESKHTRFMCKEYKTTQQFAQYQKRCLSTLQKSPGLYYTLIKESYSG